MNGMEATQHVVILGAGGTGLLMADSILRDRSKSLAGFLDDDVRKKSVGQERFPVLGPLSAWESLPSECCFISSLYDPKKNVEFYRKIRSLSIPEDRWVTVADPTEIVSSSATLGRGVYLGPATILEPNVSLGNWCAMLGRVYVGHGTRIDAYTTCANSVSIAGGVMVGSASFIGANATIREYLRIGRCTLASVGAAVIRDIPEGSIAVGDPSRIIGRTPVEESPPEQSEEADICARPVPIIKSIEERFRPSKAAASAVTTTI